jgi:hypothetical protein
MVPPSRESRAVYRLFDGDGQLLYVGSTNNPRRRWQALRSSKEWWPEVTRREVEWHSGDVWRIEARVIQQEHPLYNVMCTQAWRDECARRAREDPAHRSRIRAGILAARGASRAEVQAALLAHLTEQAEP